MHIKELYTHWLPGHADNLNVMEVLASADEAMPALAARLAGADPASAASSASAVTSQTSAPGDLAGEVHEATVRNLEIEIVAVAVLHARQRLPLQQIHPSVPDVRNVRFGQEQLREASAAAIICNAGMCDIALRQACEPTGAPAGFEGRGPSSAALSESPAALAMPAREEQAPAEAAKASEPVVDTCMSSSLSDIPGSLAIPASSEQPPEKSVVGSSALTDAGMSLVLPHSLAGLPTSALDRDTDSRTDVLPD